MRAAHVLAAFGLCLGATRLARAQANYDAALIGGRSSLMGGTGVAGGTDAAAPLQNPATTVDIEGTSFVFSSVFLQYSTRSSRGNVANTSATSDLSQTQFTALPNSTCLFADVAGQKHVRSGRHKLSICLTEPEQENFALDAKVLVNDDPNATLFQNRHIAQEFSKKVYAAGWAYGVNEWLSVGVTPMLQQIDYSDQEAIATLTADAGGTNPLIGAQGQSATTTSARRGSAFAGSALFGVQITPRPGWKTGISLETPGLFFGGSYSAVRSAEGALGSEEQYMQERGTFRAQYPLRAAFGVAGRLPWFSFEANAYLHGARNDFIQIETSRDTVSFTGDVVSSRSSEDTKTLEGVRPVMNLGLGIQVPVHREWAVLGGFLTDFGGLTPRKSGPADDLVFRSRRDRVHASVGVAWHPPAGTIMFGVRGFVGQGQLAVASALSADSTRQILNEDEWGLSLVISGQLSLEMFARLDPTGLVEKAAGPARPATSPPPATAPSGSAPPASSQAAQSPAK
jgi:hypothetical protein